MNEQEIASLIWHNGNIQPKEKIFPVIDFNFLFFNNIVEYFFTSGTEILFFNETLSQIQSLLNIYYLDSILFADESGETFKNETKRLLIRNKFYKTARCYILLSHSPESNSLNEYIFLVPDLQLFGIDKIIKKTIVSSRFFKPSGAAMSLPTLENEFRKIIRMEIDHEKADDCIILNQEQQIVESYLGNIFLIEPGKVITPSLSSGCRPLIMRRILLAVFEQLSYQVIERKDIEVENLFNANEVIVAGEKGIYSLKGIEFKRYFDTIRKVLISKIRENISD
jgi:branched-subunit amino acid aminotransferase/4-amino-4-deoxychorismate lyase